MRLFLENKMEENIDKEDFQRYWKMFLKQMEVDIKKINKEEQSNLFSLYSTIRLMDPKFRDRLKNLPCPPFDKNNASSRKKKKKFTQIQEMEDEFE